ncbi:MAG TPA: serine/threonine-protein kinase [Pyrinomonadaceae bacterium]
MNDLQRYVGQILDDKYRLERLLGQGGMGAVFLATHLGTDRYVALKLIAPQFMRNQEFVERFKREARAAGRLRHPNVVDVTDFGFSGDGEDRVAYLVMEYLDGCTLSDVLAEENRLPLYWVVDILEQVCGAVQEAHQQGILHRDLKPDNIWLEPNGLGGYRVKVLDFGIAKLAESGNALPAITEPSTQLQPTAAAASLEAVTMIYPSDAAADDGAATQIMPPAEQETRVLDSARDTAARPQETAAAAGTAASGLTRIGAILGTPLYMSPEQCRGEQLDARSDIYSIGVIAYQMLTGAPPFTGDTNNVIRAHNDLQPTPVRELNKKLPKRVARMVMWALEKDREQRPPTAIAFANAMRANADSLGTLYRRAFALYSEYFPLFLKLSLLAHIPTIIVTAMMIGFRIAEPHVSKPVLVGLGIPLALLSVAAQFVTASTISGITAIIVTQLAVAPMKPVRLRTAFQILRRRLRPFVNTGIRISIRIMLGWILLVIPGLVMTARYLLWAPVVLMEGLEKKAARQRARALASRSWRTIIVAMLVQFLVPAIVGAAIGAITGAAKKGGEGVTVKVTAQALSLVNIFVLPLISIVPALLYLKMRQFGGETLSDVMAQLEEMEGTKSRWQQRMRSRLTVTPQSRTPTP